MCRPRGEVWHARVKGALASQRLIALMNARARTVGRHPLQRHSHTKACVEVTNGQRGKIKGREAPAASIG